MCSKDKESVLQGPKSKPSKSSSSASQSSSSASATQSREQSQKPEEDDSESSDDVFVSRRSLNSVFAVPFQQVCLLPVFYVDQSLFCMPERTLVATSLCCAT